MLKINTATASDLPLIRTLLQDCGLPADDLAEARLADFLVVRRAGQAVACIGMERYGALALLRSLAVDPNMRGGGLGEQMVAALEAEAQYKGVKELYLLTTAAPFFENLGYERIERTEAPDTLQATAQFTRLCPANAVCLRKAF